MLEVEQVLQVCLVEMGQHAGDGREPLRVGQVVLRVGHGEPLVEALVVVQRQAELLEIVLALRPAGRLAGLLHGWQQQGHQDANDRNDHQQLNEGEAATPWPTKTRSKTHVCDRHGRDRVNGGKLVVAPSRRWGGNCFEAEGAV